MLQQTTLRRVASLAAAAAGFGLSICIASGTGTSDDARVAFRAAMLERFDANSNGRLDSKEQAAAIRALAGTEKPDAGLDVLRSQALAQFDKNGNGKLERPEIRTAVSSVNSKSRSGRLSAASRTRANGRRANGGDETTVTAQKTGGTNFIERNLMANGMDAFTAQAVSLQNFDLNGDGVLDQTELALAQAALRQLAQSTGAASILANQLLGTGITTATTAATGTGTTTATGTGTGTGTGTAGCMAGTGTGSTSTGSTSSGTTTSGTTASALNSNGTTTNPILRNSSNGLGGLGGGIVRGGRRGR